MSVTMCGEQLKCKENQVEGIKISEYEQEITDAAPRGRDTEHRNIHSSKNIV